MARRGFPRPGAQSTVNGKSKGAHQPTPVTPQRMVAGTRNSTFPVGQAHVTPPGQRPAVVAGSQPPVPSPAVMPRRAGAPMVKGPGMLADGAPLHVAPNPMLRGATRAAVRPGAGK